MLRPRALTILLLAWLLLSSARILGPSDLYDKEQPRTVAYTIDILTHHRFILPYDTFGIPATKPPLYNWISLPFVTLFGSHEWTLKTPSLLASFALLLTLALAAKNLTSPPSATPQARGLQSPGSPTNLALSPSHLVTLSSLAPLLYLASPMTAKLLYLARPDMLLTATLTIAWLAATLIVQSPTSKPKAQLAFWLATTAAALTKGPSALLALAYLPLAAKILSGKFSALKRAGILWGLPLFLLITLTYTALAYQQEPEFFRQVLMGREVSGRITVTPFQFLATLLNGPFYAFTHFLPWSPFALLLFLIPRKKWRTHPALAPAALWILLILIVFSFMTTKRPDRYAPIFPQMSLLAAYAILQLPTLLKLPQSKIEIWKLKIPLLASSAAFITLASLILYNQFFSGAAKTHFGDHALAFADAVKKITHHDPILFTDGELTPIESLLSQNQPPNLSPEALAKFPWSIRYYDPTQPTPAPPAPLLISQPLAQVDGPSPGRLALYPLTPAQSQVLYQQSQLSPKLYADNATSNSPSSPTPPTTRWSQFTRPHHFPSAP